jgi:hypothetical protein
MYTNAYNHWNFKKLVNLGMSAFIISTSHFSTVSQLYGDLKEAADLIQTKLLIFAGLCRIYHENVDIWRVADQDKHNKSHPDKEVPSCGERT